MIGQVQQNLLMLHDWNFLPENKGHTMQFLQLKPLLFNTSGALLTRQHVYGAKLYNAIFKKKVLLNGDGDKTETAGLSYGLRFHLLLKTASNSPNASAQRSAVNSVNAIS